MSTISMHKELIKLYMYYFPGGSRRFWEVHICKMHYFYAFLRLTSRRFREVPGGNTNITIINELSEIDLVIAHYVFIYVCM